MNIFRIFFVSTVLIPVLVVVATSDESGVRLRKPRNIVISEDGTRTARRLKPVNISDRNCPALGCTGNLTSDSNNGKGSLATTLLSEQNVLESSKPTRFDNSTTLPSDHHKPLKLEIRSIRNSTRTDYEVASDEDISIGRSIMNSAMVLSWSIYWTWRAAVGFLIIYAIRYCWNSFRKAFGIGDDYVEYYVKLGKDGKHPFGGWGSGWNPTIGISLKSKIEEGWGWDGKGGSSHHHHHHHHPHHSGAYASSYHSSHHGHGHESSWPPMHYGGSEHYGWPSGWKGWKSESAEEEDNLRHKFDKKKGWKYAQKYTKKYGKKAHKYGLRPSKYSYMFDKEGNIVLDNKGMNFAWRRRK